MSLNSKPFSQLHSGLHLFRFYLMQTLRFLGVGKRSRSAARNRLLVCRSAPTPAGHPPLSPVARCSSAARPPGARARDRSSAARPPLARPALAPPIRRSSAFRAIRLRQSPTARPQLICRSSAAQAKSSLHGTADLLSGHVQIHDVKKLYVGFS
jgi:hypothetical protein